MSEVVRLRVDDIQSGRGLIRVRGDQHRITQPLEQGRCHLAQRGIELDAVDELE